MHTKFIINGLVCFYSEEHRLEPIGGQGTAIALNVPVSRCLLLLLRRAGDVISQGEFVYEVWESKGQFANANTYFQNIHLLRKALKIAGIEESIIKTVPKEGIRLVASVTYLEEDSEPKAIVTESADSTNGTPSPSYEKRIVEDMLEPAAPARQHVMKLTMVLIVVLLALFVFLTYRLYNSLASRHSFFSGYQLIGEMNQCQVYASGGVILRQHVEYLAFFQEKNIQCQSGQVAYMEMNVAGTRVLVHICDKSVNNTLSCLTKLYIVEKKNER